MREGVIKKKRHTCYGHPTLAPLPRGRSSNRNGQRNRQRNRNVCWHCKAAHHTRRHAWHFVHVHQPKYNLRRVSHRQFTNSKIKSNQFNFIRAPALKPTNQFNFLLNYNWPNKGETLSKRPFLIKKFNFIRAPALKPTNQFNFLLNYNWPAQV